MAVRTLGDTRPMAQPQRPTGADSSPPTPRGPMAGLGGRCAPQWGGRSHHLLNGKGIPVLKECRRSSVSPLGPPPNVLFYFVFCFVNNEIKFDGAQVEIGPGGKGPGPLRKKSPAAPKGSRGCRTVPRADITASPFWGAVDIKPRELGMLKWPCVFFCLSYPPWMCASG